MSTKEKDKSNDDGAKSMNSGAPAAPEPQQTAPVVPPAGDSVLDELRRMRADFDAQSKARDAELDQLRKRDELREREMQFMRERFLAGPAPSAVTPPPPNAAELIARKVKAHDVAVERTKAELISGPQQFVVTMDGENRMERLVGGYDSRHADGKFRDYFGITGFDSRKKIRIDPVTPEAAAAYLAAHDDQRPKLEETPSA